MIQTELTAREALMEIARSHTPAEYVSMIWAQRYPHPTPASSQTGWPVKRCSERGQPCLLVTR